MRPRRRQHRFPLACLLAVLLVALSLVPGPFAPSPAPVEASPAPRITPGGAFGNAQPCLGQPDTFATTQGANTLFFPQGSRATTITSGNLPALSTLTPSSVSPIGTLGQLGAVYGLAYDDGSISGRERIFVSAFTKRLSGYGPAGAGGVYVFTRAGTGWSLMGSFQVPGATAATHRSTGADPSDNASIPGVGKTSLGDMEVSPDGRTLYIVNIGPKRIEQYDLTAATITPARLSPIAINLARISSDPAVQADLWPFALETIPPANNTAEPMLAIGVTDTATRGISLPAWNYSTWDASTGLGDFAVPPRAYVLGYTTLSGWWGVLLNQDLGNDAAVEQRHAPSPYHNFLWSWKVDDPNRYLLKAWNPWRENVLQLPERSWVVQYPQPWLTDIEFLSYTPAVGAPLITNVPYEMALGLHDRTADLVFNSALDTSANGGILIPNGERGTISQGDIMLYRFNGSAWVFQGERFDDNTHYGPPGSHIENHIGSLASIPNASTGPGTSGESVGTPTLGGLGTQEMRYFQNGSGSGASGAVTARPQLIAIDTHAATKASNLGDMEVLCSYALVGGRVWNDTNYNGTQNTGESAIAGIALDVERPSDGAILASATTDAQGRYLFAVPPNASFNLRINRTASGGAIAGYRLTRQNIGTDTTDSDMVQVGGAIPFVRPGDTTTFAGPIDAPVREEEGRSYDIGLTRTLPQGSIGDRVWLDGDGDGVQDTGERGYALPGTITLRALSSEPGVVNRTTMVGSDGIYSFQNVIPGTYELVFPAPPAGFRRSPQNQGGSDAFDSDASSANTAGPIILAGDEAQTTWDYGLVSGADMGITKSGPATATAGGLITFTLTVRNQSPDLSPVATVTDTLPAGLSYVSASPAPASRSGQLVVWSLGAMAGGASRTLTLVARAPTTLAPPAALTQAIQNCADVSIPSYDPDLSDNRGCATTTLQRPEVGIVKDAPPTALVGDEITYTLTISNSGPVPAAGLLVTDTLPTGITFARFTANPLGCTATATRVSCPATTLAAGASHVVRFVARSDAATVPDMATNTATISTSSAGDNPGNNSSSDTTAIQRPDPRVTLRIDPRPLPVGEQGSLTAAYHNGGTGLARATVLTITLDPGAQIGAIPGGCAYIAATRQAVCALGDLTPGATGAVTLPLRLPATPADASTFAPDAYSATATISTATPERATMLADNSAADTVDVVRPNVYVTASGPDAAARLSWGSAFVYTIRYGNLYRAAPALTRLAQGTVLTATLPADVNLIGASLPPATANGRVLVWELDDLAALAAGELRVAVRTSVPAGALLHLGAEIGTTTPGDDPRDNRAEVDTLVVQPPAEVPAPEGALRLAIHSELDPRHGGADGADGVYLTPQGATRIAWPAGEVLDFSPRLDNYALPDPGWPLEYRARVAGWGLGGLGANGREVAATEADSRGVRGCRGAGAPVAAGSTLEGCAYAYPGAYGDGKTLGAFLPTTMLLESEMAGQGHAYWTQPPAPPMRPDVYLFTLDPLEPPWLRVAVEVEVWLVNTCPDILLAPPGVCGAPIELPTPSRARQAIDQVFDVTLVVPRSVVGPAGP